jgi:FG-GAP repeat protein
LPPFAGFRISGNVAAFLTPEETNVHTELIVRPNPVVEFETFGRAVAISGNVAIVGADNDGGAPGRAYVFTMDASGGTQRTMLTPSGSSGFDGFGGAVAIDGNYAVVGAPGHYEAYVFGWNGSSWSEQAHLMASDPSTRLGFGEAVGIGGDYAIIGAGMAAYIFRRTGSTWVEEAKLTPPPTHISGGFGRAVALQGDCAIVGASWGVDTVVAQGAAYIFRLNGSSWDLEATLAPPDPIAHDLFGASVAIDGDYVVVGAPGVTSGNRSDVGGAYVFQRIGASWQFQRKLEPSNTHSVNDFGEAVAINGNYIVVGDPAQHLPVAGTGAAYIYRRSGTNWNLMPPRIVPSDAGSTFDDMFAWFGQTVAVSNAGVLVGAPGNTDTLREQGAAYFYPFPIDLSAMVGVPLDWAFFAEILFGLIGGGGGVIVRPGGPRPIDPEPFAEWNRLPSSKRNLIMGLALTEIASFIEDNDARQQVKKAGQDLTKKAAARLTVSKLEAKGKQTEGI